MIHRIFAIIIVLISCSKPHKIPPHGNETQIRIFRGFPCSADDFPFIVLVIGKSYSSTWMRLCGGTLISATWVLTAAHCFALPDAEYAVLVPHHLGKEPIIVPTKEIFPHKYYDSENFSRDIALMRLDTPLDKAKHVDYVGLPKLSRSADSNPPCINGLIMGWGVTEINLPEVNNLQCAMLPIMDSQNCSDIYGYHGIAIPPEQMCTLSMEGIDACSGDSGGPLLCGSVQIGIISWGIDCGEPEYPGVYTRTDMYLDFIAATMRTAKNCFVYNQLNVSLWLFCVGLWMNIVLT